MLNWLARPARTTALLLLAGIIALTGVLPANAKKQRVALANGQVLEFNKSSGHPHNAGNKHSIKSDVSSPSNPSQ
jgi:hypothetical protein